MLRLTKEAAEAIQQLENSAAWQKLASELEVARARMIDDLFKPSLDSTSDKVLHQAIGESELIKLLFGNRNV